MKEALVVMNLYGDILYSHLPNDRTSHSLPDSRKLWEFLWENRKDIWKVAHSHPGGGVPSPSAEDLSTFSAIEAGLGKRLFWFILSEDYWASYYKLEGEEEYLLMEAHRLIEKHQCTWPFWAQVLHDKSYGRKEV